MSREHNSYPGGVGNSGGEAPNNYQGHNSRGQGNNNNIANMGRIDQTGRSVHNGYTEGHPMGQGNMDYQHRMPMVGGYPGQQPQEAMGMVGFPHGMDGAGAMMMGHPMHGYDMMRGGGPGHYPNDMMNHRRVPAAGGRAPETNPGNANASSDPSSSEPGNSNAVNSSVGSPSGGKKNANTSDNKGMASGPSVTSMQHPENAQLPEQNDAMMRKMMLAQQRGQEEMMRLAQQQGRPGPMDHANMGGFGGPMGNNAAGEQTMHGQQHQSQQKTPQGRMPTMYDGMGGPNHMGSAHNAFASGVNDDSYLRQHQNPVGGAGSKRNAPTGMPYDPSAYAGGQMKYPPHPHYNMMHHHAHSMAQGVHPMHMQAPSSIPLASQMPPQKKRRSHKKKPPDMPRRPLSAYNLFFSEERERILKELGSDNDGEGGDTKEEGKSGADGDKKEVESEKGDGEEGGDKPKALMRPMVPNQKSRRPHRKTHGKVSFQQLAKMVGQRWKSLPEDKRKYYQDLAQEDMKRQKIAMEEYYARQQAIKHNGQMDKHMDGSGAKVMNQLNL